jgi:general secretion pathway protein I
MTRWRRTSGFTLIEVLVALAIVAIALLAALRVAGQGANNAVDLRARLCAGWVAENRARVDWLPLGVQGGNQRQGGIDFTWRQEVIATPNAAFRRVDVFVFAAPEQSHAAAHLAGFVVNPRGVSE